MPLAINPLVMRMENLVLMLLEMFINVKVKDKKSQFRGVKGGLSVRIRKCFVKRKAAA
jgi:hypothetical protein